MEILALYHLKGGVGKTAAAVNLSYLSGHEGNATLLCDLDPQGSASYYFNAKPPKKLKAGKFIRGKKINSSILNTGYENLDILPSTFSFRNLDVKLDSVKHSKTRLRDLFSDFDATYRYIFIDSPPNINLVSENIMYAADIVLVPLIPTTLSILSYKKLNEFFASHDLDKEKVIPFFSMVDRRKRLHREIVSKQKGGPMGFLNSSVPYSVDVEKMGEYGKPLTAMNRTSTAKDSYIGLWEEIKEAIHSRVHE